MATIIVADDNTANRDVLASILRYTGHRILEARDGAEGLRLAREHLPDLPGENVLRQLQADARTRAMPVVVLSADALPRTAERLVAAGARMHMTKPIDIAQFHKMLGRIPMSQDR